MKSGHRAELACRGRTRTLHTGRPPYLSTSRNSTPSALQIVHIVFIVMFVFPASMRLRFDLSMSQRKANSCTDKFCC